VNAALNDTDIMRGAYAEPDFYELSSSYIADKKSQWYSEAGKEFYNQNNKEKAQTLLKQSGYQGEPFNLLVSSHYQEFYNGAIVIEKQLKDLGINVNLKVVDWATYLTQAKDPNAYDAFVTGFIVGTVPNTIIYLSPTWNGWSNDPHLIDSLADIVHSPDPKQAKDNWDHLQEYFWSDYMPVSKLGNKNVYAVSSSKVDNMIFFQGPHAWNVTVEP
jgi:peptide/nickel transport system substrate-binding protein